MQRIELNNMLPAVFAGRADTGSEVWLRNLTLERGKKYLISAESGTGKSSLCSYIYGFRTDYSGVLSFDGTDVRSLDVARWCEVRCRHLAYLPQELAGSKFWHAKDNSAEQKMQERMDFIRKK